MCFMSFICASTCQLFWWWEDNIMACNMFICLQNCLNISHVKFVPVSEKIFLGSPTFCKYNLDYSNQVISCETINFFHKSKLAVVSYNAQKCGIFYEKDTAPTASQGLHGTSYGIAFSCGCVCWYSKHVAHHFMVFQCLHSCSPYTLTSSLKVLFLCPYGCCVIVLVFASAI